MLSLRLAKGRRGKALTQDIIAYMIVYLEEKDALSASMVCKEWLKGGTRDVAWKMMYYRVFGNGGGTFSNNQIVCKEGKDTTFIKRFARRAVIERNMLSGKGVKGLTLRGHTEPVRCVLVWWESGQVFSGSNDKTVREWSLDDGKCVRVFNGHQHRVHCLGGNLNKNTLMSGDRGGNILMWNTVTGECLFTLLGHTGWISDLAYLGDVIFSCGKSAEVKMWDGKKKSGENGENRIIKSITGGTRAVSSIVNYERKFICGDWNGDIRIFDMKSGDCTGLLFHAPKAVLCMAIQGDVLVAGCADGKLRSWDLSVGKDSQREFENSKCDGNDGKLGKIFSVSFQEGVFPIRVISRHDSGEVLAWDTNTAKCMCVISKMASNCFGQVVAADLHRLAFSTNNNEIKILDFSGDF